MSESLPHVTDQRAPSSHDRRRSHAPAIVTRHIELKNPANDDGFLLAIEFLRENETRLRLALDAAAMGTFLWRIAEDRCAPDRRMLELFGLPAPRTFSLADFIETLLHPDDRTLFADAFARAIDPAGTGTLREDVRVLHADGSSRWLTIVGRTAFTAAVRLVNGSGAPRAVQIAGVATDITDRKRGEANLALLDQIADDCAQLSSPAELMRVVGGRLGSHLQMSSITLDAVDEGRDDIRVLHVWSGDGSADPSASARLSDFVNEDLRRAARAGETVFVGDTEHDPRTYARSFADMRIRSFVMVPFVRDGEWKFVLAAYDARAHRWREDEVSLFRRAANRLFARLEHAIVEQTVANDLHDTQLLQQMSAQLIEEQGSASLYETLVDAARSIMKSEFASMQMLFPDRGAQGELRLIAARGFDAAQLSHLEWIGVERHTSCAEALRTRARVVTPDLAHHTAIAGTEDQALLLAAGLRASHSTPLVSRTGKTIGMISTHWARPHEPSERELRQLDILARQAADLIERTQAEDALRRSELQLKESDRRKDEFLATLAHELRNPLAPLRTSLELIRLPGTPEELEETRLMMEEQVRVLVRLVDDLLDVSRITSGKIRLQPQPTHLGSLVARAVQANRVAIDAGQISLQVKLPDTPVLLDVDATRFVQVVSNVLNNAVKFTDPGGEITISAELISREGEGARDLSLAVTDSGIGIAKDMLPRVFELFTQDDVTASRSHGGLGIGLALARRLIDLHGGSIEARSEGPGLGSRFTIRIPVSGATAHMQPAQAPPSEALTARIGCRVVVIDDNPAAARSIQRLVKWLGGECRVAHTGEAGLVEMRERRPDVVILDIGMPGLDGYETCRRIREEFGSGVTLVALTGWGQQRDKQNAVEAGFDVHLTKPADPNALEELLLQADARRSVEL